MNGIVFQEMREARGLAYSAGARIALPGDLDHNVLYYKNIATQNDKLMDALDAFAEIINEMPVSEPAFTLAKESLLANYRTARTVKANVLWSYLNARKRGLDYDLNKELFEKISNLSLDDVVKYQKENIKGLEYRTGILGRISDFDLNELSRYGKIKVVSIEEIFGY